MFRIFLETVHLYEHDRRNLENSAAEITSPFIADNKFLV